MNEWATYQDAIQLILTGNTNQRLSINQQLIMRNMLAEGIKDEFGNPLSLRNLNGVRSKCPEQESVQIFNIPDLFCYISRKNKDVWRITCCVFNLDYVQQLTNQPDATDRFIYEVELLEIYQQREKLDSLVCKIATDEVRRQERIETLIDREQSLKNKFQQKELDPQTHPLSKFKNMDSLAFNEVSLRFDPENYMFKVNARNQEAYVALDDLGLTKKNKIEFNAQGSLLIDFAKQSVNSDDIRNEGNKSSAFKRLNTALRNAFGIQDKPFINYKPVFTLSIPKDVRAKQKKTTVPYIDNMSTNEFFKQNDPEYDENDELYRGSD